MQGKTNSVVGCHHQTLVACAVGYLQRQPCAQDVCAHMRDCHFEMAPLSQLLGCTVQLRLHLHCSDLQAIPPRHVAAGPAQTRANIQYLQARAQGDSTNMHFYDKCCTHHIRSAAQTQVISGNTLVNGWRTDLPTLLLHRVSGLGAPCPLVKRME
jgi:hypothetical protein